MRRDAATAATRQAILDAARGLLATGGPFSLEAVAAAAGVTRVTVYNQVGSRDGLLDAVLTELTGRAGMDRLLTATRDDADPLAGVVRRTCRFWHAERPVLRPLFAMAVTEPALAANLARREGWRRDQFASLTGAGADALSGIVAVTSFPAYDSLGSLAAHPRKAAAIVLRMVRALVD
jgi:AcrR family transcriptional regulator